MTAPARAVRGATSGVLVLGALLGSPATGGAQQTLCQVSSTPVAVPALFAQDACFKAQDIFTFLAPQIGVALSGGNVLPGEGGSLGGWGRRSAVLRVTAVDGRVPRNDVSLSSTTGPVASDFGATRAAVPVPSLTVGIGLFRGVPVGLTNVGGVDLLVGVTLLPSASFDQVTVRSDGGGFATTVGARVGILQESAVVPGVALSVMHRRLPTTSLSYSTANDTLGVLDTRFSSTAYRLTANKRFGLLAIGGGFGQDRLDARTSVDAILNETVQGQPARARATLANLQDKTTRRTVFVHVALGLPIAQLVLEVGRSSAGEERPTLNTFGDRRANEAYQYGSVGFGFRF